MERISPIQGVNEGKDIKTEGDLMDGLVASIESCSISEKVTGFQANMPLSLPIKQNVYVGMNITQERYIDNLCLLGVAWVRKVQHVARLTLNSSTGPVWPVDIEPLAVEFFKMLSQYRVDWASTPYRADYADEIDFVWREIPSWLPATHLEFIAIWEHVTGMARTWGLNWHQNETKNMKHFHVLAQHRVPNIAQYIRTNKFYRVGDDEAACERPQSLPRYRQECHHTEIALILKRVRNQKLIRTRARRKNTGASNELSLSSPQSLTTTEKLESPCGPHAQVKVRLSVKARRHLISGGGLFGKAYQKKREGLREEKAQSFRE